MAKTIKQSLWEIRHTTCSKEWEVVWGPTMNEWDCELWSLQLNLIPSATSVHQANSAATPHGNTPQLPELWQIPFNSECLLSTFCVPYPVQLTSLKTYQQISFGLCHWVIHHPQVGGSHRQPIASEGRLCHLSTNPKLHFTVLLSETLPPFTCMEAGEVWWPLHQAVCREICKEGESEKE
jgi:hypothetical protein